MKKILLSLLVLLYVSGFQSCEDSIYTLDDFYVELGITVPVDNGFYIITDNGTKLWPSATNIPWFSPEDTTRVIVNYSMLGPSDNSDYNYYIKINQIDSVLTKSVVFYTEEIDDSLGNDPVFLQEAWITNRYLNVDFRFVGGMKIHMVNLTTYEDSLANTPVEMELRHNAYNDYAEGLFSGLFSFDLKTVFSEVQDSIQIKFNFNEYPGDDSSVLLWYVP